jgi:hypothetical protein
MAAINIVKHRHIGFVALVLMTTKSIAFWVEMS